MRITINKPVVFSRRTLERFLRIRCCHRDCIVDTKSLLQKTCCAMQCKNSVCVCVKNVYFESIKARLIPICIPLINSSTCRVHLSTTIFDHTKIWRTMPSQKYARNNSNGYFTCTFLWHGFFSKFECLHTHIFLY